MSSNPREAIRHLLRARDPADALASYYALHHPPERTAIITYPAVTTRARGYLAVSRTGMDLFRPLVTMRLPTTGGGELDLEASVNLLYAGLPTESAFLMYTDSMALPLLRAVSQIDREQSLRLLRLDRRQHEPVINVFVLRSDTPDGQPRFVIRNPTGDPNGVIVASAGINWMSPDFADVAVHTQNGHRRQGYALSVLSSLVQLLFEKGRTPLYTVEEGNDASYDLARSAGFVATPLRAVLLEGFLRARPPTPL